MHACLQRLALIAAGLAAATAAGGDIADFAQLRLGGHLVQWQMAASPDHPNGAELVLAYRIASHEAEFPGAANCGRIGPLTQLLSNSRISARTFRAELDAAFDMWRAAANISFVEAAPGADAQIIIGAQSDPEGWAYAQVFYDATSAADVKPITLSLVCLNPLARWKIGFDGNLRSYDLRYTLAHEIGHAMGLDHSSQGGQLMWYRYEEQFRHLQVGDVVGISHLYGSRRESEAPRIARIKGASLPR